MDVLDAPLVLTKLRAPSARPRIIPRARLTGPLSLENHRGLFLIRAPAGYGKTTLLAEWSRSLLKQGVAVAWYALDPGDDDPFSFGEYLATSLMHALGPIPELARVVQLLRASPETDLQRLLPAIINAVLSAGQNCVLVLDDYHLIHAPQIHRAIAFLLDHQPDNLWVAIGSRSDPPLPLARLRARGRLLEVNTTGLRFTRDETARFFNEIMRLDLPPHDIAALEERTEGWIAGLQLAALSLAGASDRESFIASYSGEHRFLVEYLMEEVFLRLPDEIQSFILVTSILERMCPPLCCAVLQAAQPDEAVLQQAGDCEALLSQLEQANLFIVAMDDQGYWFRYHHLFRDFLQTRLKKTHLQRVIHLHRAACEWLAANAFLREAAVHAFQTRDMDYAAAFVEQHSFTMIIHSDLSTIHEWCSAFPEEVLLAHPMLCVFQCWAWVFTFRRQNRDRVEARLRQAEQAAAEMKDPLLLSALSQHAAVVRSFLSMAPDPYADPMEQLLPAQEMLSQQPEHDTERFSTLLSIGYAQMARSDAAAAVEVFESARQVALRGSLFFGIIESTFHLARIAQVQGRFDRAVDLCRQSQAHIAAVLTHPDLELPALGVLDIVLACGDIEQDRLIEAEEHLRRGLDRIGWGTNHFYLFTAYVALFRLHEIQGRSDEALKCLSLLESAWPDIEFCTRGLRVIHSLRLDPTNHLAQARALAWSQDYSPAENAAPPGMGPFGAAEVFYAANQSWSCAQIAAGRFQEARTYLERQLAVAAANGLAAREIETAILLAMGYHAEGDREKALAWLERALKLAEPAGCLRTFDRGKPLTQLLVEAQRRGIYSRTIERILAVTGETAAPDAAVPIDEYTEPLSERELEVLRLIAGGATNQAIAGRLYITVGTVKSHINHILGKLGVSNRTEAAARAREMGLL